MNENRQTNKLILIAIYGLPSRKFSPLNRPSPSSKNSLTLKTRVSAKPFFAINNFYLQKNKKKDYINGF